MKQESSKARYASAREDTLRAAPVADNDIVSTLIQASDEEIDRTRKVLTLARIGFHGLLTAGHKERMKQIIEQEEANEKEHDHMPE